MTVDSNTPHFLREMLKRSEAEELRKENNLIEQARVQWKEIGEIKDKELLKKLSYTTPSFFNKLLSAHPASALEQSVNNARRAFDILARSFDAFIEIAGKFHFRLTHAGFSNIEMEPIVAEATAEIFTYSCADRSLVQAYRHLASNDDAIADKCSALFVEVFPNGNLPKFLSDLRNNNNHISIISASPSYTVTFGEDHNIQTSISFDRDSILSSNEWSAESKNLIRSRKDTDALAIIAEHFRLAKKYYSLVFWRTGVFADKSYKDLKRLRLARETFSKIMNLNLVKQGISKTNPNPYPHLDNWFSEGELENILCLPDHSREQVDYMIAMRDPLGLCDEQTKKELYQIFGCAPESGGMSGTQQHGDGV